MGLPRPYWRQLHRDVTERRFGAGAWVDLAMDEAGALYVLAKREITAPPPSTVVSQSPTPRQRPQMMRQI